MTRLEVRPWSIDAEEREPAAPAEEPAPFTPLGDGARSAALPSRAAWNWGPIWAAAPLGIAVLIALVALISPTVGRADLARVQMVGFILLLGTAGAILYMGERTRDQALADFERAVRIQSISETEFGVTGPHAELVPALRAVRQQLEDGGAELRGLQERQERAGLEQRLADIEREQTRAILDNLADAIVVTDEFDRLLLLNPAAEALLNLSRKEHLRRPAAEFMPDPSLAQLIRHCREAGSGSGVRKIEHAVGERTYAICLSGVETAGEESGQPTTRRGVIAVLRDVTKEKEINRAKSDFVAKVAHELRTPLSSIKAYVEMLADGEACDEKTRREYYEIIQTSSDRLSRLIDNMLNIARIESGTVRVNKEPISLAVVVKDALDVARPQAEAKGLKLVTELTPVFYQVLADRDMTYQAVLNLLTNAIKYTPEGGQVTVRMAVNESERTVSVLVSDTGVGIPEEDLPRMFEKFFRVKANSKMAPGTGLGLNLVKHFVETVHGGRVGLTSRVGEGSTFTIALPLHG